VTQWSWSGVHDADMSSYPADARDEPSPQKTAILVVRVVHPNDASGPFVAIVSESSDVLRSPRRRSVVHDPDTVWVLTAAWLETVVGLGRGIEPRLGYRIEPPADLD